MKKYIILFLFNLLYCLLIGQSSASFPAIGNLDTLYYFDFDGGLPNGWTLSGNPSNALWEYRGPNTTPSNAVGSRGAYNGNRGPINSPTWHNGFMIFDSDYLDNGGVSGASGTGPVPLPHACSIISDTLDFSNMNDVGISFQSYMRIAASGGFLIFSTDGGNTFTDTINIHEGLGVNEETNNSKYEKLNISNIVGGESEVAFKLLFDGNNPYGLSIHILGYYFWQFDDILFFEIPNNDLVLEEWDVKQGNKKGIYGIVPNSQTDSISFKATVFNAGKASQSNTTFFNSISSPSSGIDSTATNYGTLLPNQRDSISQPSGYLPLDTGNYNSEISVFSDSTDNLPHNNSANYSFRVSDSVFALDHGTISSYLGTYSFTGSYDDFQVLNLFEAKDSLPIKYVWAKLDSTSRPGASVYVVAYDSTGATFGGGNEFLNQANPNYKSQKYVINHADSIKGYILIPVKFNLKGGMYVGLEMNSQVGKFPIGIAVDESVKQNAEASLIYILNTGLYTNPNAALIRLGSNKKELIGNDPCDSVNIFIEGTVDDTILKGNITIDTVFGGNPPYLYLWQGPNGYQNDQKNITGLSDNGNYVFTVTDSNGCVGSEIFSLIYISTKEEKIFSTITLSPNPTKGFISLEPQNISNGKYTLSIRSIDGKLIEEKYFKIEGSSTIELNLFGFEKGMYILELVGKEEKYTQRVILK